MPLDPQGSLSLSQIQGNRLLAAFASDDAAALLPHFEGIDLEKRHVMERPGVAILDIYFPLSGLGSVVAVGDRRSDQRIETQIFGREGMSGLPVVLGADSGIYEVYVQIAGHGLRLPASVLTREMEARPAIRNILLKYVHAAGIQTAHTALANGRDTLEVRLARWLVMAHDRTDGEDLALTHEFLSLMLGVRRAGVTVAMHLLEGHGLVRLERGSIRVVDRDGLIEKADGSYGKAEAEYERLVGQPI